MAIDFLLFASPHWVHLYVPEHSLQIWRVVTSVLTSMSARSATVKSFSQIQFNVSSLWKGTRGCQRGWRVWLSRRQGAKASLYSFIGVKAWVVWSSFCKWYQRLQSQKKRGGGEEKKKKCIANNDNSDMPKVLWGPLIWWKPEAGGRGGVTQNPGEWHGEFPDICLLRAVLLLGHQRRSVGSRGKTRGRKHAKW